MAPKKVIEEFTAALMVFQNKDRSKARSMFQKLIGDHPTELEILDRARAYLAVCDREVQPDAPKLRDVQDQYNQGVYLLNRGETAEAAAVFSQAIAREPGNEKVLYAHACALARSGKRDEALQALSQSIQVNPSNRILARHDVDLESLREEPGFKALLKNSGIRGA